MPKRYHVKSNEDLNNLNASINSYNNNATPTNTTDTNESMAYDESVNVMPDGMLESVRPTDIAILAIVKDSPEVQEKKK